MFKKDMNVKGDLLRSRRGWVRRENRVGKVDGISSKYDFHIYIHIYEKIYEYIYIIMRLIILYNLYRLIMLFSAQF